MPSKRRPNSLSLAYAQHEGAYRDFAACVRDLITQIIAKHGITVHSVTCRAKTQASLNGKLSKAGKSYAYLNDVTDLAGVRIITYFTDDADAIANLIEAEFEIDVDNSVDKRRLLEPNEFGYLSIHHVACLPERRAALTEYSRFSGLKVEIQIRSILQHAWAEIEHDLGYKSAVAVPRKLRRRISRLAGLLELADQEFRTVRDEIGRYERDLPKLVIEEPQTVELDKPSLEAYVKLGDLPKNIDQRIAEAAGGILDDDPAIDYALTRLSWLGIKNLAQVEDFLCKFADPVIGFATDFLTPNDTSDNKIPRGMSVFYLAYILVGQRSPQAIELFVRQAIDLDSPEEVSRFAELIAKTWSKVMKSSEAGTKGARTALRASPAKRR